MRPQLIWRHRLIRPVFFLQLHTAFILHAKKTTLQEITLCDISIHVSISSIASFQSNGKLFNSNGVLPDILLPHVPGYYVGEYDNLLETAQRIVQYNIDVNFQTEGKPHSGLSPYSMCNVLRPNDQQQANQSCLMASHGLDLAALIK